MTSESTTALELVLAAAQGSISRTQLVALLCARSYAPREYTFPISERRWAADSLDAVDIAYFDRQFLTDDEYLHIVRTAVIRVAR